MASTVDWGPRPGQSQAALEPAYCWSLTFPSSAVGPHSGSVQTLSVPWALGHLWCLPCSLFSERGADPWDGLGSGGGAGGGCRDSGSFRIVLLGWPMGHVPAALLSPATAESAVCLWLVLPGQLGKLEPLSQQSQRTSRIGLSIWQPPQVACGFFPKLTELVKTEVPLFLPPLLYKIFLNIHRIFSQFLLSISFWLWLSAHR